VQHREQMNADHLLGHSLRVGQGAAEGGVADPLQTRLASWPTQPDRSPRCDLHERAHWAAIAVAAATHVVAEEQSRATAARCFVLPLSAQDRAEPLTAADWC
jgi:hypothetical protein